MGTIYLLTSIFTEAVGKTVDKLNFQHTKISPQLMTVLAFSIMSSLLALWIYLTRQPFPEIGLLPVGLVLLVGLLSFGGNVFDVLSLKRTDLSLREPLTGFESIMAGLLSCLFFPDQAKITYLIAFILGLIVVCYGISRRKLTKSQKRGLIYLCFGILLYAILPNIYQITLEFMSPDWLALLRCIIVLMLVFVFFMPNNFKKQFTLKKFNYTFLASVFYAINAVVGMYAISTYGVAFTMLFFMLGPALKYLSAHFILKEKVQRGEILSSLMLAVIAAMAVVSS